MKLGNTRQAIHDALAWGYLQTGLVGIGEYLVYLTRVEKSMTRKDTNVDFMEAGYVCAAINVLAPHLGGWLKFAYGPEDLALIQSILAAKLRFDLFPLGSAKRHIKLLSLSSVSLEDYRLRLRRNREMPVTVYAERMNVNADNWARDEWQNKRDVCLKTIMNWDREGVGQVSRMVKSLRGENNDGERPSEILSDLRTT